LIVIGTSNGSRRHHQVPRGGEDLLVAEFLPKLDIEIPAGILLADQAAHYQAIGHLLYYPAICGPRRQSGGKPCPGFVTR
jgi:hypothetical protein